VKEKGRRMIVIAIDCGASFIKAARVVCEEQNKIEKIKRVRTPVNKSNVTDLDASIAIIRDMIEQLSEPGERIAVGICNEMHGFVLMDECGDRIGDYFSWQMQMADASYQGETYLSYLRSHINGKDIETTGMPLRAGIPSTNLFAFLNSKPGAQYKNLQMSFYTLGDYYIKSLTGMEPVMHDTNAAGTGIYDVKEKKWNSKLIDVFGFQKIKFPKVCRGGELISVEWKERKLVFYPALGDQQAALLGGGLKQKGELSLNFGTGAQMSVLTTDVVFSENYQLRPYFDGYYLKTVPHIPSGRALNVYFRFVREIANYFADCNDEQIWKYIQEKAVQNEKPRMAVDMSFFENAITKSKVGKIENISEKAFDVGNLFDSAYHTMAENAAIVAGRLGISDISKIIITGGVLTKNSYLKNLIIESIGLKDAEVVEAENETLKGIVEYIRKN
jgi:sugar (pentulose or hexulose) kinase